MRERIPKPVQEAIAADNRAALSAMGRAGARERARSKEILAAEKIEREAEAADKQAKEMTLTPEGDVLPPGEDNP